MDYTNNRRQNNRFQFFRPIELHFGSQVIVHGQVKDLSPRSAFVVIKQSVYCQTEDQVGFKIFSDDACQEPFMEGQARISRISPGEGIAIYFTQLTDGSKQALQQLSTPR